MLRIDIQYIFKILEVIFLKVTILDYATKKDYSCLITEDIFLKIRLTESNNNHIKIPKYNSKIALIY